MEVGKGGSVVLLDPSDLGFNGTQVRRYLGIDLTGEPALTCIILSNDIPAASPVSQFPAHTSCDSPPPSR